MLKVRALKAIDLNGGSCGRLGIDAENPNNSHVQVVSTVGASSSIALRAISCAGLPVNE